MAVHPPVDITPKAFFENWLPAQLAGAPPPRSTLTVRVRLDGDDGGVWDLVLSPDGLQVVPGGTAGDADVKLTQTVADWRAITVGEPGAVNLAPPQASPKAMFFVDGAAQQIVQQVKGTIRFEVTGYNGRTWVLVAKLGAGPTPETADATISVDAETYGAMLARAIPPAAAYFQGKIVIAGDPNLAMQIGMALMPRYS